MTHRMGMSALGRTPDRAAVRMLETEVGNAESSLRWTGRGAGDVEDAAYRSRQRDRDCKTRSKQLRRRACRPIARPLVRCTQLRYINIERSSQRLGRLIGEVRLAALDPADRRSVESGHRSQLRLSKASQIAPVSRKALTYRNMDQLIKFDGKHFRHCCELVDLGRRGSRFPSFDRCHANTCQSREVGDFEFRSLPRSTKPLRSEAAYDAAAHVLCGASFGNVIDGHIASQSLRSLHVMRIDGALR